MRNKSVKLIIATHKKYKMPNDKIYLPLHVGAEGKKDSYGNDLNIGYQKDNYGDNISLKNSSFCELTGLYWAWRNLDEDYIGLVHYRRYFVTKEKKADLFDRVITYNDLKQDLGKYKIFVPKKRNYIIETLYSHYKHTHYIEQLDETRKVIELKYPNYIKSYDKVMKRTYGYMFNMMIMEKTILNNYCKWLFDILFELEKRIEMPELSFYQGRFYGRISELLLNVWIEEQLRTNVINKEDIKELPYIHMEKIDWIKKGTAFLKAKFLHKKYNGSF